MYSPYSQLLRRELLRRKLLAAKASRPSLLIQAIKAIPITIKEEMDLASQGGWSVRSVTKWFLYRLLSSLPGVPIPDRLAARWTGIKLPPTETEQLLMKRIAVMHAKRIPEGSLERFITHFRESRTPVVSTRPPLPVELSLRLLRKRAFGAFAPPWVAREALLAQRTIRGQTFKPLSLLSPVFARRIPRFLPH